MVSEHRHAIGRALLTTLVLILLAGCASRGGITSADRSERLGDDGVVALAPIESEARGENDHPLDLEPERLRRVLASIRLVPRDEPGLIERVFSGGDDGEAEAESAPLFTDEALESLAPAIAGALAEARPDQDVVVSIKQSRSGFLGGAVRVRKTTTARIFHRDGRLQVIPGFVDRSQRATLPESLGDQRSMGYAPVRVGDDMVIAAGSRRAATDIAFRPVSELARTRVREDREDWLALSLDAPEPDAAERAEAEAPAADRAASAPETPRDSGEPAGDAAAMPEAGVDVETVRRAETLRELRERDLIDEDTYQDLLRDILDDAFRE